MAKKYKWQIKELKYSKQLRKFAEVILINRVEFLIEKANKYFNDKSVENLHQLRIALRRVRYPMEVFYVCFNKKTFTRIYNKIQKLQDLSGATRDIDVAIDQISLLVDDGITNEKKSSLINMVEKKKELQKLFDNELLRFIKSKIFKDFYNKNF